MSDKQYNEDYAEWAINYPKAAERLCEIQNAANLRGRLRKEFSVPESFMNITVDIWHAGKEG